MTAQANDGDVQLEISDEEFKDMKSSYVTQVLKRRIYFGKSHQTTLEDLKKASSEILDYYDDVIATAVQAARADERRRLLEQVEPYLKNLTIDPNFSGHHNDGFELGKYAAMRAVRAILQDQQPAKATSKPCNCGLGCNPMHPPCADYKPPATAVPVGDLGEVQGIVTSRVRDLALVASGFIETPQKPNYQEKTVAAIMTAFENYITEHYGGKSNE